jgi:hypothetical protein
METWKPLDYGGLGKVPEVLGYVPSNGKKVDVRPCIREPCGRQETKSTCPASLWVKPALHFWSDHADSVTNAEPSMMYSHVEQRLLITISISKPLYLPNTTN